MRAARLLALLVAASVSGCAHDPGARDAPKIVPSVELAPYASHQDCFDLVPGDRLDYSFESTDPVAFNLGYRDGGAIVMPITRDGTLADGAVFAPRIAQRYCMSWEAGGAGAKIGYRVQIRSATR